MRRAKNVLRPMGVTGDVLLGRFWRSNDEVKFDYYSDFKQSLFVRFWLERGNFNLELSDQWSC